MNKTPRKKNDLELAPDAWKRFERAVDVVAKSPPQPRETEKSVRKRKASPKGKGSAKRG